MNVGGGAGTLLKPARPDSLLFVATFIWSIAEQCARGKSKFLATALGGPTLRLVR
jgi:hypothetical protein